MNKNIRKTWKVFCVFFVSLICLTSALMQNITEVSAKAPPQSLDISNDRVFVTDGTNNGYTSSTYQIRLVSYDEKNNTAVYKIGCYWTIEGKITLYSDNLYVNDQYIGTFSSNNGLHSAGYKVVPRTEWFYVTLKGGYNSVETRNVSGIGGEMEEYINLPKIGNNPIVHGTDGTWYEGEVESGLRTWSSLYTDGATGSTEGNKVQTSTGFMYSDVDEQKTPVNAYHPSAPVALNSAIIDVKNASGQVVPWRTLNNAGTYIVTSKTMDSSGLTATGTRKITVLPKKYNIVFDGNGATSGSTASQACAIGTNCTLNANGFVKSYKVTFDSNGGSAVPPKNVSATFSNWLDVNGNTYANKATVKDLTSNGGTVVLKANWYHPSIITPSSTKSTYTLVGWREKDGTVIYDAKNPYTPTGDVTLYAVWDASPTITSEDRYFFTSDEITNDMLLERVKANDEEDGDLTKKVVIKSNTVKSGIEGVYDITYEVKDKYNKIATSSSKIYIIDKMPESERNSKYLRFISSNYLDTLNKKSIWRTDLQDMLKNSLARVNDDQAKAHWKLSPEDIERIKAWNDTHDWSQESNQAFLNEFSDLLQ